MIWLVGSAANIVLLFFLPLSLAPIFFFRIQVPEGGARAAIYCHGNDTKYLAERKLHREMPSIDRCSYHRKADLEGKAYDVQVLEMYYIVKPLLLERLFFTEAENMKMRERVWSSKLRLLVIEL